MKQRKERLATSLTLTEKLVSFIACGTFMSGQFLRYLMHFLTLSESTELDFTIMADGITCQSCEWDAILGG
jgi:hypothetical protein